MVFLARLVVSLAIALICASPSVATRDLPALTIANSPSLRKGCRLPSATGFTNGELVTSPRPHEVMDISTLPKSFFWGNASGVNYLTEVKNQHIPQYCGSCWAFATATAMADRIKIKRNAAWPDVVLATQVLLNCHGGGSCNGGDPYEAYVYMAKKGLPDQTCQTYEAEDQICKPLGVCEDCTPGVDPQPFLPGTCFHVSNFSVWKIQQYGLVDGGSDRDISNRHVSRVKKIKAEILKRGPISCGMDATDEFVKYSGGVYEQITFPRPPDHEISLVGWGVDEATGHEYWIGRNSWGMHWGELGFFRIRMYRRNLGIELTCSWADPNPSPVPVNELPALVHSHSAHSSNPEGATSNVLGLKGGVAAIQQVVVAQPSGLADGGREAEAVERGRGGSNGVERVKEEEDTAAAVAAVTHSLLLAEHRKHPCLRRSAVPVSTFVKSPLPSATLRASDLPPSYDIRNINGVSYATLDRNQHIPRYCGSCWAFGSTAALSDRAYMIHNASFPHFSVSQQVIINCVHEGGSMGCNGGDPTAVYSWIMANGAPDESCANYEARDKECNPLDTCSDCDPVFGCRAIKKFPKVTIEEHGKVSGEEAMMAEIYARGPIACGIAVTDDFWHNYGGGVYNDTTGFMEVDHIIEVAGWGSTEDGVKYWIGRNSWGTYWGEKGWFRIIRGTNNLAIESDCDWAVPKMVW